MSFNSVLAILVLMICFAPTNSWGEIAHPATAPPEWEISTYLRDSEPIKGTATQVVVGVVNNGKQAHRFFDAVGLRVVAVKPDGERVVISPPPRSAKLPTEQSPLTIFPNTLRVVVEVECAWADGIKDEGPGRRLDTPRVLQREVPVNSFVLLLRDIPGWAMQGDCRIRAIVMRGADELQLGDQRKVPVRSR